MSEKGEPIDPLPLSTPADTNAAILRGIIGSMPGGSLILELLGTVWMSPDQARVEKWLEHLRQAFNQLQQDAVTWEDLRTSPLFRTLVIDCSRSAVRTSSSGKMRALKNAIVNGTRSPLSAALQETFLQFVSDLTEHHIDVLAFVDDPAGWLKKRGKEIPQYRGQRGAAFDCSQSEARFGAVLRSAFPSTSTDDLPLDLIMDSLRQRGLLGERLKATANLEGFLCSANESYASPFGKKFLKFISDAEDLPGLSGT